MKNILRAISCIACLTGIVMIYFTNFAPASWESWAWGMESPAWMVFIHSTPRDYFGIPAGYFLILFFVILLISIFQIWNDYRRPS